ncbi:hypothetical protein [Caulobacter phage Cr30]|uniref:hypothetical protein n=1 Tax=Caulobacter phage Cr30 TaxID=1357714 RepID=UPI0004A9B64D|nr:hypothetical protein OZ74_gp013 [Caulobacter phage Cr30]AGS80898.1 hypothetical protein [Caulobacter phage Cr30]
MWTYEMIDIEHLSDEFYPPKDYQFSEVEKQYLRPIAETLAMLDGNAFFGIEVEGYEHYEQYLHQAFALFTANGGVNGNAGQASFVLSTLAKERVNIRLKALKWFSKNWFEIFFLIILSMIALGVSLNCLSWVLSVFVV